MNIIPKHLWFIAGAFWVAALAMAIVMFFFSNHEFQVVEDPGISSPTALLPIPRSFLQPQSLQDALNSPAFSLTSIDRPIRLPDMRSLLMFYGSNERPDCFFTHRRLQFGVRGTPGVSSAVAGEKIFFRFDSRNKLMISDTPTPLVAVFSHQEPNVQVTLEFQDEQGVVITVPSEFHSFSLAPSPAPSTAPIQWLVGSLPVDNSLLDRQGAMWWGQDEVVQDFGGDEMVYEACRQRVQFGCGDDAYVLWVAEGDCFAYDDDKWTSLELGCQSIGKPLLKAKSIDARAIHFQLWNPDGSVHHSLDLVHREAQGEVKIPEVKMIGARSKKHWIADIQGKRLTLTPDDWVLLKPDGFVQVDNEHILDEYLQGRLAGDLLAFSGIEKVDGELCLVGTFYDSTRTRQAPFAISLYRSWGKKDRAVESSSSEDDESDDDDADEIEFDDDDDDDGDGEEA